MAQFANDREAADALTAKYRDLQHEISNVIVGQREVVDDLLAAIFCRGHALLVGVPGLAKTLLISTIAQVLDLKFNRIQFTPDLMPSDILGTEILEIDPDTNRRSFKFIRGPIFANVILADEINRTPPKTQAALLEAMQERKVSIAGSTHSLDQPFFVLATQNPIEQEGTYPLPEAQLDRFMFFLNVDYPSLLEEIDIVKATTQDASATVRPLLTSNEILTFQSLVRRVPVPDNVVEYAVKLVHRTRPTGGSASQFIKDNVTWGAGPRASQFLVLGAKAKAVLNGRYSPDISDVRAVAKAVLRHRVAPSFNAEADGITADAIIERLIAAE
jgi:MoxR-like ATPase